MKEKRVVISVTNDLATDQRVARTCSVFHQMGWEVVLVGRKLPDSLPIDRPYRCVRFRLPFSKGVFFYATYNIWLFLFLMFNRCDLYFSNDLDTLLPNFLISRFKRVQLVYDSHEYFTEVPEIQGRTFVKSIWQRIESFCLTKMQSMITVNESIAELFRNKYGICVDVIRNVPFRVERDSLISKKSLGLPEDKKILILQGAGINIHRGAEEAVAAMKLVEGAILLIVGNGDVVPQLKAYVVSHDLSEKVRFIGKVPADQLRGYTTVSDIGLSLDKPSNINYEYSLPNKLFDYIQAGIAVVASNLVEVAKIVHRYRVGEVFAAHEPTVIADCIQRLLNNQRLLEEYKCNAQKAAGILCWENEKKVLERLILEIDANLEKKCKNNMA